MLKLRNTRNFFLQKPRTDARSKCRAKLGNLCLARRRKTIVKTLFQSWCSYQSFIAVISSLLINKLTDSLSLTSFSLTGVSSLQKKNPRHFAEKNHNFDVRWMRDGAGALESNFDTFLRLCSAYATPMLRLCYRTKAEG